MRHGQKLQDLSVLQPSSKQQYSLAANNDTVCFDSVWFEQTVTQKIEQIIQYHIMQSKLNNSIVFDTESSSIWHFKAVAHNIRMLQQEMPILSNHSCTQKQAISLVHLGQKRLVNPQNIVVNPVQNTT